MPSTYSSNLKIELMATGENANTWGTITNTNLGTALEQAIVGYGNPEFASDANLTISLTNSNAAQAARALVLNVTSAVSLTTTRELVVPTIQKPYTVQNNTTGGQSITVKTLAGTGVTVPNGRRAFLYVDGTNVVQMFDFVDINGGAIDGTPIGASSASSGSFTSVAASSAVSLGNGTAGTPALNATADTNTGLYFPAADSLGLVTGGSERVRVDSTGLVGLNTTTPASYGGRLTVYAGDVVVADAGTSSGASAPRVGSDAQALVIKTNSGGGSASEIARFDGSGNLGLGATSPAGRIDIRNTTAMLMSVSSSGSLVQFRKDITPTIASAVGNAIPGGSVTDDLIFSAWNGSAWAEQARLDASGNLGVGRAPVAKVTVQDTLGVIGSSTAHIWGGLSSTGFARVIYMDSSGFNFGVGSSISSPTGGTFTPWNRIRSNGQFWGSASQTTTWGNSTSFMQGPNGTAMWTQAARTGFSRNVAGIDSGTGFTYVTGSTAAALYLQESDGTHAWSYGAGGSAGTGFTPTRLMTLDTSGNLGIGTASPTSTAGYTALVLNGSSGGWLRLWSGGTAVGSVFANSTDGLNLETATSTPIIFKPNLTERMRLDTSGNLGIGVTAPDSKLDIRGSSGVRLQIYETSTGNDNRLRITQDAGLSTYNNAYATASTNGHVWQIGSVEQARLTSVGLGIGTSDNSSFDTAWQRLVIGSGSNEAGQAIYSGSTSTGSIAFSDGTSGAEQYAGMIRYLHSSDAMAFWTNATERMRIDSSGNLIQQVNATAPTLSTNGTMSFELTSDTSLKIVVRGTDGVTRSVSLTLA